MKSLERLTTEYVPGEDRIRLSGEQDATVVVVWLTMRLVNKLVPALLEWLERQTIHVPRSEVVQEFKQQAAKAGIKNLPPVQAQKESEVWLASTVDINRSEDRISLNFKDKNDNSAVIVFSPTQLRQWLEILHGAFRRAGWPREIWPGWIMDNKRDSPAQSRFH